MRPFAPVLAAALLLGATNALATPPLPAPPAAPLPDPWFGSDKALHFAACTIISGGSYSVGAFATPDLRLRIVFGAGAGILAGAGKELLDLAGFGDPSWRDFAWDVIGTIVGVGLAVAVDVSARGLPGQAYAR